MILDSGPALGPKMIIGVYDPLSAMAAERMGADALWLSSYSYSVSQGIPDLGLLPFSAEQSALIRISTAVNIPVIVDIDNGFGSVEHALNIARRSHDAGAAGICIEDKMSPKISSLYNGQQTLLKIDKFTEIIKTIKKDVADLEVWARLEGLNHQESVATIRRKINLCHDAGADCILVHNIKPRVDDLLSAIAGHKDVKIGIIPTNYMSSLHQLKDQKLHAIVLANQLLRAAYQAFVDITGTLLKEPSKVEPLIAPIEEINSLI